MRASARRASRRSRTAASPARLSPARSPGPGVEAGDTGVPGRASAEATARSLPWARNVLAVIARPGQESAGLGALLYAFRRRGARLALLCLTRGEASPLNSTCERLETVRPWELQVAAGLLGVSSVTVSDYPDGGLSLAPVPALTEKVRRAIRRHAPDLLLVVDPAAAGDPDDARAAKAACLAAEPAGLPVLAHTRPGGRRLGDRTGRRGCGRPRHPAVRRGSAPEPVRGMPEVLRRLHLLGGRERLRWLVPPAADSRAAEGAQQPLLSWPPDRTRLEGENKDVRMSPSSVHRPR